MQEQSQNELLDKMESQPDIKSDSSDKIAAKRKKMEKYGFIIMIIGFAALLIPNQTFGRYGEYTMFAGAMMYFSGRLVKK